MAFGVDKGDVVDKSDLDDLATLANLKLTPQDFVRTVDLRNGDPADTITGAFAFSDETDPDTPRWAWLDEINRIWQCLWNIPANATEWNEWDDLTPPDDSAKVRVDDYWPSGGTDPNDFSGDKIVASPGPHVFQEARSGFSTNNIKVYSGVRAIYTSEQPDFQIASGVLLPQTEINGDGALHEDFASRVQIDFDFSGFTAFTDNAVWGYFEIEWTRDGGADPTNDSEAVLQYEGAVTGGVSDFIVEGDSLYVWFEGAARGVNRTLIGANNLGVADTLTFVAYTIPGWRYTAARWRGGFLKTLVDAVGGTNDETNTAQDRVIHPRNESVRAAQHVNYPVHLTDPTDILDFASMDALLSDPTVDPFPVGQRAVDVFIRNSMQVTTRELLDDYPTTEPNPAFARAAMVADLNDYLIDYEGCIYSLPTWEDVTLRPGTQWFVDLDPIDPVMRQRMNRLLLEDAYPTQIKRIPDGSLDPENEILELQFDDHGGACFSPFGHFMLGCMASEETAKVIYLADALPQWAYHSLLDLAMPNGTHGSTGNLGPRGELGGTFGTWLPPVLNPTPVNWPVFHVDHFGIRHPYSNSEERADVHTRGYAPFWDKDEYHSWSDGTGHGGTIAAGGVSYNAEGPFISTDTEVRYEYNLHNRDLTLYAGRDYVTDQGDTTSWEFKSEDGIFKFPEDIIAAGHDPSYYYGGQVVITIWNNGATSETFRPMESAFTPVDGEDPPIPDPNFFATNEPNNEISGGGESYRFGPIDGISGSPSENRAYPVPQRGYMVRDILIQRVPVENAAGILVPPDAADTELRTVHIGLMAGAGIIAGAIHGCYPGNWMELDSCTMPAGVLEERFEVNFPVLEGCPLAYYVSSGDGTERFNIFASVEFQPAVNNTFVTTNAGLDPLEGAFYGRPFLHSTWGWSENFNATSGVLAGHRTTEGIYGGTDKHRLETHDAMPPISAKSINELYTFIVSLPDL